MRPLRIVLALALALAPAAVAALCVRAAPGLALFAAFLSGVLSSVVVVALTETPCPE